MIRSEKMLLVKQVKPGCALGMGKLPIRAPPDAPPTLVPGLHLIYCVF